ncbi:MAG: HD domain-containing protein, partial [Armatimonadota bacterium]|nr:HD domain-containing protein [Armatimonadota bacterium]MDW8154970.1 HD domain-containing protein [Armatimonadota bacterium]
MACRRLLFVSALACLLLAISVGHAAVTLARTSEFLSPLRTAGFMGATFLAILAELKPTRLPLGSQVFEVTLSSAVALPVLLLSGWPFALLLMLFATATSDFQLGKPWYKVLYNVANYSWSIWLAGNLYSFLLGGATFTQAFPVSLSVALGAGVCFATANTLLVVFPVATIQGLPYGPVFRTYLRAVVPFFAGVTSLSVAVAALWQLHPLATVLLFPALLTTKLAYDNYVRLRLETDNFLHALADAVDLRDPYTAQHSIRVAELARALGERLGLQGDTLWGLHAVARVHDVGKVTIPDAVLLKA